MSSLGPEEAEFLKSVIAGGHVDEALARKKKQKRLAKLQKGLAGVEIAGKKKETTGTPRKENGEP